MSTIADMTIRVDCCITEVTLKPFMHTTVRHEFREVDLIEQIHNARLFPAELPDASSLALCCSAEFLAGPLCGSALTVPAVQ